jgi:hypothetical protein
LLAEAKHIERRYGTIAGNVKEVETMGRISEYKNIPEDEEVFVLRAQDVTAPMTIMFWIQANLETAPPKKLRDAFDCARRMMKYEARKRAD